MSRQRQFGTLRSSRTHSQTQIDTHPLPDRQPKERSNSKLCVNCVNKSLSKQKQMRSVLLREAEKRKGQQFQHSRLVREQEISKSNEQRTAMQYRQMLQYNTQASRELSEKKQIDKMRKEEERRKQIAEQKRLTQERECNAKRERLLAQKLFKDLKQQIAVKESQNHQTQQQTLSHSLIQPNLTPEEAVTWQQQRKEQYRKQLTEQMQREAERKQRVKEEERQHYDIRSNPLIERAEQRQQQLKQIEQQRKQQLLEDAQRRQRELVRKKEERQAEKHRERESQRAIATEEEQRAKLAGRRKEEYIQSYLKEVKQDISLKELKIKQLKTHRAQAANTYETFYSSFDRSQCLEQCGGCEKNYPQSYLAQYVQP